jgi:hypothetical protein
LDDFWEDFLGTDFVADFTGLVGFVGAEGFEGGFGATFAG